MSSTADVEAVRNQRERYLELAGMLKEKRQGTGATLKKIVAQFALQEGVNRYKANATLKLLVESGLVSLSKGKKVWKYNADEEWDLFKVSI